MESPINERLNRIIELLKISSAEFSRRSKISTSLLSKYQNFENNVSLKAIEKIMVAFPEINRSFLQNGYGHPILTRDEIEIGAGDPAEEYSDQAILEMIANMEAEIMEYRKKIADRLLILQSLKKSLSTNRPGNQ